MDTRRVEVDGPFDLALTLRPLRRGPQDPCTRLSAREVWRATRTPDGPATQRIEAVSGGADVEAWGPGAAWLLEHAPVLVGARDGAALPFEGLLAELDRRHRGMRMPRTDRVVEALVPTVLEQKVTSADAHRAYGRLVRRLGEPAPGPRDDLLLPPAPEVLAATPYYDLHTCGIERRRAEVLRGVAARADRIEGWAELGSDELQSLLRRLPGIGPWTAGEVGALALGDADAVPVGDYHLPALVAWNLAGERIADDARMLELLEPYRPHRYRVIRLLAAGGAHPPRRAPRMPLRDIAGL